MNKPVYLYTSAQAGAGKTRLAVAHMIAQAQAGYSLVYAAPTIILIEEVHKLLQEQQRSTGLEIIRIDSDINQSSGGGWLKSIRLHVEHEMKKPRLRNDGHIILTTHETLFTLDSGEYQSDYQLIIDEAAKGFESRSLKLGKGEDQLLASTYLKDLDTTDLKDIKPSKLGSATLNKARDGASSELWTSESARAIAADILSDVVQVELLNPNGTTGLSFMCYRSHKVLECYDKVKVLCANARDTFLYHLWDLEGVRFLPMQLDGLSPEEQVGHRGHEGFIEIRYLLDQGITKGKHINNKQFMKEAQEIVYEYFEELNLNYIYCLNSKAKGLKLGPLAEQIPVMCHGMNKWKDMCGAAYLASTNLSNVELTSLKAKGMEVRDIAIALKCQNVYQMVCRTYVRWAKPAFNKHIYFVVPDKEIAEYLQKQFVGSSIEKLGDIESDTTIFPVKTKGPVFNKQRDLRMAKKFIKTNKKGFKPIDRNISQWAKNHSACTGPVHSLVDAVLTNYEITEEELLSKRL